jgi:hypothetical protein
VRQGWTTHRIDLFLISDLSSPLSTFEDAHTGVRVVKVLNGNVCIGFNEGAVRVWSFSLLPLKSDQASKDEPCSVHSSAGSPLPPATLSRHISSTHHSPNASSKLKPTGAASYLADMLAAR